MKKRWRTRTAPLLRSSFGAAWHNRGSALAGLKRYKEALACYDRRSPRAGKIPNTWKITARRMLSLKQDEGSPPLFSETALRLNPDRCDAPGCNRARAFYDSSKRFSDAVADSERALHWIPGHAGPPYWDSFPPPHLRLAPTRRGQKEDHRGLEWRDRGVIEALDSPGPVRFGKREILPAARLWVARNARPPPIRYARRALPA